MFYDCGGSPGWLPLELVEVSQALVSLIRTNSKISTSRPHVGNFGCLIFNFRFYFLTFRIANVIVSTTIEYQSCHMVMCWRRNFFLHLVLPSLVERACVVALFLLGDGKCALDKHTHLCQYYWDFPLWSSCQLLTIPPMLKQFEVQQSQFSLLDSRVPARIPDHQQLSISWLHP